MMPSLTIDPIDPLRIEALTPERLPDFLRFFDGDAFADHPAWRFCYCQFLHVDHTQVRWASRTLEQNRSAACERITGGRMQGLLAYRAGRVVAWCNAAPRSLMEAYADAPDPDDARIGQIDCFVVAKPHRRNGVARALLQAALRTFQAQGLAIAQATPSRDAGDDARQHHGPLGLYLAAGFTVHREDADGALVVRRRLK